MTIGIFTDTFEYEPKIYFPFQEHLPENRYRFVSFGEDIECDVYKVHHETPCGVVIEYDWNKKKFIHNDWKKKFAYPTPEEALTAFKYRKEKQIEILTYQLELAKRHLKMVEAFEKESVQEVI